MNLEQAKKRIYELINILNNASEKYYAEDIEVMSNFEYDKLSEELKNLENTYDIHLSNSPTQKVGYKASDKLEKVVHKKPMLSLDKTKSREELKEWLKGNVGVLSYKLDGLTIVLTYENGILEKGVTRGDGVVGEDVTSNVKNFQNIPLKIKYKNHMTVRGEAIIKYSDFNKINDENDDTAIYKNPRNLCSGSVRQLDPNITRERKVYLYAFDLVELGDNEEINMTYIEQMNFLDTLGFDTVFKKEVTEENIIDTINWYETDVKENDIPSDGLVLKYNDIKYGLSLGLTSKFPRNAIAFKWEDETMITTLREIEWSPSKTGLLNPVAIFDEVELCSTTVKRASLHNISIMEELQLGIGDKIKVYKANMIIPQIAENITKSNTFTLPKKCPICNSELKIHNEYGSKTLHCENEECPIKLIKTFEHFVSRDAFDIEGISIASIEKFVELGFIKNFADIFTLDKYKDKIINMQGFGIKSYENMINAINEKRYVKLHKFINSLSIKGIGSANSKLISNYFDNDLQKIMNADKDTLCSIDFIGPQLSTSIYDYFHKEENILLIHKLLQEIQIDKETIENEKILKGKTFVITGDLVEYKNRDELVNVIENLGGKVSSSVSSKTSYLINNDISSTSTKNKKANELKIPIINEKKFKEMYLL